MVATQKPEFKIPWHFPDLTQIFPDRKTSAALYQLSYETHLLEAAQIQWVYLLYAT